VACGAVLAVEPGLSRKHRRHAAGHLVRYRRQDSFADNYFFLLVLPAFLAAKYLLLSEAHFPPARP
jgi:undecaprenyl pyrophosphate phosphatase UppP